MTYSKKTSLLRALARTCRIMVSYEDNEGQTCWAGPETLAGLVNTLAGKTLIDAANPGIAKIKKLLAEYRQSRLDTCLPQTSVAWNGKVLIRDVWLPEAVYGRPLELSLKPGTGKKIIQRFEPGQYDAVRRRSAPKGVYCKTSLKLKRKIPYGYYDVELECGGEVMGRSFLIAAPKRLKPCERAWGAFGPVYAMRSGEDWGIGDFHSLEKTCAYIRGKGGRFVGTLPMLAGFTEGEHADPSPYSPVSRLFWNEIYLDMNNLPCISRLEIEPGDKEALEALRATSLVDYDRVYALKKKYLLRASERFFSTGGEDRDEFDTFLSEHSMALEYADFRSREHPESERAAMRKFHLYAQFAIHRQLLALGGRSAAGETAEIYLDYPVGVHNNGFDAGRMKHLFIPGFNVGAPPDEFSDFGQDWGFMPMHPARIAADRFNYFRDALHNYFRYAKIIRLDHIMGFYRIFCVPHGGRPADGAYIRYPLEAFLAVLTLEAWLHDGVLIGEDLGTVPPVVRKAMRTHGFLRTWLFQFYLHRDPAKTFRSIPKMCIAALNTHDMFPFRSFWEGEDINKLEEVGALEPESVVHLRKGRKRILKGWKEQKNPFIFVMRNMASASSRLLLVNLEDLWSETKPQNMPGTTYQYPNWRKKFRRSMEEWMSDSGVNKLLKTIDKHR